MPTQILPAASLRSISLLPAVRALVRTSNYLIWMALWSIWRVIFRVEENVLPALREGRAARRRPIRHDSGRKCPLAADHGKAADITEMRSTGMGEACYPSASGLAARRGARREEDSGILSRAALRPDAPDIVRDFGDHFRDAADRARQHRRHPVRRRGLCRSDREGADHEGSRARQVAAGAICELD